MKRTDFDPSRVKGRPGRSTVIFDGAMQNQGYVIKKVELRQYVERNQRDLGDYSLLTVVVETDKGSIEMKYDEGFRGPQALESAATLIQQYVGIASLVNRALIELQRQ